MFPRNRKNRPLGFTLIELAIVLGVVGILSAGLWRLMSAGNQQTKDQATAQQQLALIDAVEGYLADTSANSGQALLLALGANNKAVINLPTNNSTLANCQTTIGGGNYVGLCNFLPTGFNAATTNPYGQTYSIRVLAGATSAQQNYSFMIVTSGGTTIPDSDGGRISGLIGGDGGFIYTSNVCGGGFPACGTMGSWSNNITTYGFAAAASGGKVASRSFVSANGSSSLYWLARVPMASDPTFTYNTMTTNLFMGSTATSTPSNIFLNAGQITAAGASGFNPEIILIADPTTYPAAGNALLQLSTGPLGGATPGCTQLSGGSCPAALNILNGDINLANGEVLATKIYSASDMRLKKDIRPLENPLENLMKIGAVSFTFKASGSQSMGVTAQNLEKTYPQLVSETNGTKYVDYNGLIGPLIGAVQELKKQNDDLREQLHQQSLREDRLEQSLKK